MNDYVRGALEALMWARVVFEDLKGEEGGLERSLGRCEGVKKILGMSLK